LREGRMQDIVSKVGVSRKQVDRPERV